MFWDKVNKCKHKNLYDNYLKMISCSSPYCYGHEVHCKDCNVYISTCGCGSENGMSGWSKQRWRNHERKKSRIQSGK